MVALVQLAHLEAVFLQLLEAAVLEAEPVVEVVLPIPQVEVEVEVWVVVEQEEHMLLLTPQVMALQQLEVLATMVVEQLLALAELVALALEEPQDQLMVLQL